MPDRATHLDLFSGIGGFALAAGWAGFETIGFSEIDEYASAVLRKHWPGVPIFRDVNELIKICEEYVLSVNNEKFLRVTPDVSRAIQSRCVSGVKKTHNSDAIATGNTTKEGSGKSSIITAENAFAAESPLWNFFASIINPTTDRKKGQDSISPLSGKSPLSEDSQMTTKSCVTTATTQKQSTEYAHIKIDLLSAGVPCQPASCAGKRGGSKDNRWLWPQTLTVIGLFKPTWVLLENVPGLLSLNGGVEFEYLLSDLEGIGYAVQPLVIPACAVDARHRRDRVWIVGYAESGRTCSEELTRCGDGSQCGSQVVAHAKSGESRQQTQWERGQDSGGRSADCRGLETTRDETLAHSRSRGWEQGGAERRGTVSAGTHNEFGEPSENAKPLADRQCAGLEIGQEQSARQEQQAVERSGDTLPDAGCRGCQGAGRIECGEPEPTGRFAESRLGRVVDGVSAWLDEPDIPRVCTGTKNRQARLKALGNAIVPAVAFQILKAMQQCH